jgi:hypothetical protein
MANLKYYNSLTSQWETLVIGKQGSNGALSPNAIINGAFDIWQRGTSFTQANSYTADRWQQSTDKTATISRQAFTPGTAPVAGYEGEFFLRHNASAGGTFQVVQQRIEDVRTFAGQTVTLSYWAKADVAVNNVIIIEQDFGTGGSSAVATSSVTHALTTSWTRYTATFAVPSVAGRTIGANSSLIIRVIRTIDALAHIVDIWGVQLEAGAIATPFRRNAPSIQAELAACQRYYFRTSNSGAFANHGFGLAYSTTGALIYLRNPVQLRTSPVSLEFGNLRVDDSVGSVPVTNLALLPNLSTSTTTTLDVTASTLTQFRPLGLSNNNNAAGFVAVSAEL